MIQWVRNLDRAQLGDFSALCGINWDHLVIFNWWLGWTGRSKMASHVYLLLWWGQLEGWARLSCLFLQVVSEPLCLVSEPEAGLQTWYVRTLREQWGCFSPLQGEAWNGHSITVSPGSVSRGEEIKPSSSWRTVKGFAPLFNPPH